MKFLRNQPLPGRRLTRRPIDFLDTILLAETYISRKGAKTPRLRQKSGMAAKKRKEHKNLEIADLAENLVVSPVKQIGGRP